MANDETRLLVSLEARLSQFEKAFQRAEQTSANSWSRIERQGKQSSARLEASFRNSAANINNALGMIGVGVGIREVTQLIDSWTRFTNQLRVAGREGEALKVTQGELFAIAQKFGVQLEAVGTLYGRNAASAKELGLTQAEQLKIVEATSAALKVSGQSSQQAAGALLQLSQMLGGTVVQSQEYNSLLDGARPLLQAVAAGSDRWKGSVAALTQDVKASSVTVEEFVRALLKGAGGVIQQAEKATNSLSQSMTVLSNAFTKYIGELSESEAITTKFGNAAAYIAEHLNSLGDGAAAAAAILLSRYIPSLAGAAIAQTAMLATNPFALLAIAAGGAAFAIAEYGDKIKPIHGELANLQDYAGAVWDQLKDGASAAATAIGDAFDDVVQLIARSLGGSEISMADLGEFAKLTANTIVNAFKLVYDVTITTFTKLPQALAELFLNAFNGIISIIESSINGVISAIDTIIDYANSAGELVGVHLGQIGEVSLGRIKNNFAGAGKEAADSYIQAIKDAGKDRVGAALEDLHKRALERARLREAEANKPKAPVEEETPGTRPPRPAAKVQLNDYERAIRRVQENIATMRAETEARRNATGTMEQQEAQIERAKIQQELLNSAQRAGIEINDSLKDKVASLADAYQQASLAAKEAAKNQQEAAQRAEEFEGAERDAFKGFIKDLASGKSASEALRSALARLGEKMLDMGLDMLTKQMFKGTGNIFTGGGNVGLGSLFGGNAGLPAQAATANVNAGVVNVGGTGVGALTPAASNPASGVPPVPTTPVTTPALIKSSAPRAISDVPIQPLSTLAPKALATVPPQPLAAASYAQTTGGASAAFDLAKTQFGKVEGQSDINSFLNSGLKIGGHDNINAAQTAWCSAFVNSSLNKVGLKGSADLTASSFLKFGKPVKPQDVMKGDIAVVDRGVKPGVPGDHVGFATGQSRMGPNGQQQFQMLAGNSGPAGRGSVNYEWRNANTLKFRRPTDALNGDKLGEQQTAILRQQEEAQKQLQQQLQQTTQATRVLPQSLQGVQVGSQGLDGSLASMAGTMAQGAPAANSFSSSLQSLLSSLQAKPGGGGGLMGLGGLLGFAEGGSVSGPGSGTSDSIPAMLSDGEFVVNSKAASKHGKLLAMINDGKVPKFAVGGPVGGAFYHGGNTTNINVQATGTMQSIADQIAAKVAKASKPREKPADSFRRTQEQSLAAFGMSSDRAARRNG